jgi:PAS domain S-box-containing protein
MENLLEALKHTADGAYIIDAQQRIIFWNKAAEALLGFTAQEVLGRPCYQIIGGRDETGCPICRRRCLPYLAGGRGESIQSFDVCVRDKDGRSHWLNVSTLVLPGDDDKPRAIVHLFRIIDVQKQMEVFVRDVASQARHFERRQRRPPTTPREESSPAQLTPRETQVLELLARGMDTTEIAQALVISKVTVRNHVQHILHKLNVHSRLEAVAYALQHDLI